MYKYSRDDNIAPKVLEIFGTIGKEGKRLLERAVLLLLGGFLILGPVKRPDEVPRRGRTLRGLLGKVEIPFSLVTLFPVLLQSNRLSGNGKFVRGYLLLSLGNHFF